MSEFQGHFVPAGSGFMHARAQLISERSRPEWRLSQLARIQEQLRSGSLDKRSINSLLRREEQFKKMIDEDNKKKENERIEGEESQMKENERMFKERQAEEDRIEGLRKRIDPFVNEDIEKRYTGLFRILDNKQMLKDHGKHVFVHPGEFSETLHIHANPGFDNTDRTFFLERFKVLSKPYYDKFMKRIEEINKEPSSGGRRHKRTRRTRKTRKTTQKNK